MKHGKLVLYCVIVYLVDRFLANYLIKSRKLCDGGIILD